MKKLAIALSLICVAQFAFGATVTAPPSLKMNFVVEGDNGVVTGTLTAPDKDNGYQALPVDTKISLRVVRACYTLSESGVEVASFTDVAPGAALTFTDNATPEWQYGYEYTYNAYATVDGAESYAAYAAMKPGIPFAFADKGVTISSEDNGQGGYTVKISALIPDKTSDYPPAPLEIDMTSLNIYRVEGNTETLLSTIDNPVKGETCVYEDKNPVPNVNNRYKLHLESRFGFADRFIETLVGYDLPRGPYPITGEWLENGGYKLSWTAPTEGVNWGNIDPAQTRYNVYRCWGTSDNDRVRIAEAIAETEYVDMGTDMQEPMAVRYTVESLNNLGVGLSNNSSYDFDVLIGPEYALPFEETFDGGPDKVWEYESSSYYAKWDSDEYAELPDGTRVNPQSGSGLECVDFTGYVPAGASATLTSYKIDLSQAETPELSLMYYRSPGTDVTLRITGSAAGHDSEELGLYQVSGEGEAGWTEALIPLIAFRGADQFRFSIQASFTDKAGLAIIDAITVREATISEFSADKHTFAVVKGTAYGVHEVEIKEYTGTKALYKAPEMVTYNDVTYTVVGILKDAYRGNKSLYSVNFPDAIATIGESAFEGCETLAAVSFGTGLRTIESRAFADCSALAQVVFTTTEVPTVAADAFSGIADPCEGKCPEGMEEAYAALEGLAPISFLTGGVSSFPASDESAEVEYFLTDGTRVSSPVAGTPVIVRVRKADGAVSTRIILAK